MPRPRATSARRPPVHRGQAQGSDSDRRHDQCERQTVEAPEGLPGALAEDDVGGPHDSRERGEADADEVEPVPRRVQHAGHEHDAERRRGDGDDVPGTSAQGGGEPEGSEELDRHGDADRQVGQRGVERGVHRGERQSEEHDRAPVGPAASTPRRPRDGIQDDHGEEQPQEHRAGGSDPRDERGGEGAAELDGDDSAEDEQGGGAAVDAHGIGRRPAATRVATRSAGQVLLDEDAAGLGRVDHATGAHDDADVVDPPAGPGEEVEVARPDRVELHRRREVGLRVRVASHDHAHPSPRVQDEAGAVEAEGGDAGPEVGQPDVPAGLGHGRVGGVLDRRAPTASSSAVGAVTGVDPATGVRWALGTQPG